MPKFKVVAEMRTFHTIEIEAENESQAWQLGREADGGEFSPANDWESDWRIYDVKEVTQ